MCQLAIRKLLQVFLKQCNKKKTHFSEGIDKRTIEFNKDVGRLIALEFHEFKGLPS
jgi:hypothetical protein